MCVCKGRYISDKQHMLYCNKCKDFIHEGCSIRDETKSVRQVGKVLERALILDTKMPESYQQLVRRKTHYDNVPEDLVMLARSHAIRGKTFGITGNVLAVAHARKYLKEKIMDHSPIPYNWKETFLIPNLPITDLVTSTMDHILYTCPRCSTRF